MLQFHRFIIFPTGYFWRVLYKFPSYYLFT